VHPRANCRIVADDGNADSDNQNSSNIFNILRDYIDQYWSSPQNDRMLVAQAIAEPVRLLTADRALAVYGDAVMVV
jgi:PIN domain nuclease of toxin-antitoxin system